VTNSLDISLFSTHRFSTTVLVIHRRTNCLCASSCPGKIECMFESIVPAEMGPVTPVPGDAGAVLVRGWAAGLPDLDQEVSEGVRIDRITAMEELKAALAAAQARETEAFVASRREARAAAGISVEKRGRGLAKEVGLARMGIASLFGPRFAA
jgi:hypothetical protein